MGKTFEIQFSGFVALEAETKEDAAKQALVWQEAVADGGALDAVENANGIQTVELVIEAIRETS